MEARYFLTTNDNPYSPKDDFESWLAFDQSKGYNTCGYLNRILKVTDDMTESEINDATEIAIDEILHYDFMNLYKKVKY